MTRSGSTCRAPGSPARPLAAAVLLFLALSLVLAGCARRSTAPPPGFGASSGATGTHVVVSGDTVYGIARRNNIPMRALIEENGLTPPFLLRIGQVLRLPNQPVYVVQRGDTVYSIARRNGVDMNRLASANGLGPDYMIQVGQSLVLPADSGTTPPPSQPAPVVAAAPPQAPPGAPATRVGDRIGVPPPVVRTAVGDVPLPPDTKPASGPAGPVPGVKPVVARGPVPQPPARAGAFDWPVDGQILSNYGPTSAGQHNDGINIAAARGTPVKAAESGVVAYAGNEIRGFGNLILLKHAGGLMSAYAHNEALLVGRGQTVGRGQAIARVGATGGVSRPQLHFEIRKDGKPVDPKPYLTGQRVASR